MNLVGQRLIAAPLFLKNFHVLLWNFLMSDISMEIN